MGEISRNNKGAATVPATQRERYVSPNMVARTQRAEKGNMDAGLTTAQREALAREEARINRIPAGREETVVVDENGVVNPLGSPTVRTGTRRRGNRIVTFAEFDSRRVPKDSIMIHNHPGFAGDAGGLASQVGTAFSGQDLATAASVDAKEIRAIARGYTYSIKRPAGGWPSGEAMKRDLDRLSSRYMQEYSANINGRRLAAVMGGGRDYLEGDERYQRNLSDRTNVAARARAMREVAKKYGLKYTRRAHGYNK